MNSRKILATMTLTAALAFGSAAFAQMPTQGTGGKGPSETTMQPGMNTGMSRSGAAMDKSMTTGTTRMKKSRMTKKQMMMKKRMMKSNSDM